MCFGPPSAKVFSHLLKKKYNRADLAGGECFWADALWWDRMHYGETECLKQRCVHQQVSDSSGWLMLMHFIFKFNCPPRLPRSILIWAPPQSWPYLQHLCERRKIFQPVSRILILEIHNAVVAVPANVTPGPWLEANLAGESNSADLQSIEGLWRMTATDHIQWCSGTTICAKGMTSLIDFRLSVRPTCLTHADALWWDRMHYGETECLKQRCVHQQVSDSSGWLMLTHFIFKFNCPPRPPRSILIWAPPRSWPYLQHLRERRKIFQLSRILILEIHNAVVAMPANVTSLCRHCLPNMFYASNCFWDTFHMMMMKVWYCHSHDLCPASRDLLRCVAIVWLVWIAGFLVGTAANAHGVRLLRMMHFLQNSWPTSFYQIVLGLWLQQIHRRFYTQTLLHTDAFTHRDFYTQTLLHRNTFTHRRFYTQALLHTDDFTHRRTILHTDAFTHKRFYTQTLLHSNTLRTLWNRNFTSVFDDRTSFRAKGLRGTTWNRNFASVFDDRTSFRARGPPRTTWKSQFFHSFWRSNLISCERVARDDLKSQFFFSFWRSNLISCERVARDHLKSQFFPGFWRSNLISCERVARDDFEIAIFPQFLTIEPHFVRKGCAGRLEIAIFL